MKKTKKLLSVLLTVVMIAAIFPVSVFAEDTKSDKHSVTVYFTLSEDGYYVTGNDENQTQMARVPITVDYFDLADYGLENYYRYESADFEDGGYYIGEEVLEQPTVLHLYIKALEKYYLNGEKLDVDSDALTVSGNATSLYMSSFWGHDENLMYYVNHRYPLMAPGWGATLDYILLEDGMEIDVAMFSNWSFWSNGAFATFDKTEHNIKPGEEISFKTIKTSTSDVWGGGSSEVEPLSGLATFVWDENWGYVADLTEQASSNGEFSFKFDKPGKYYVTAIDTNAGTDDAIIAPATAVVNVSQDKDNKLEGNIYYQLSKDGDTVRFVAELNEIDILSANSGTIEIEFNQQLFSMDITTAYKAIKAEGKIVKAPDDKCFVISNAFANVSKGSIFKVRVKLDNFDKEISRIINV